MKAVVSAAQMRAIDAATIGEIGLPGAVLMENAGRAVAAAVSRRRPRAVVAVVCGVGNNGGDGFVAARVLREWGIDARVFLAGDIERVAGDARTHLDAYRKCGGVLIAIADSESLAKHRADIAAAEIVVDAVFGTGLARDVGGHYRSVVEAINASSGFILSVDLPSGMSADTGRALGVCVRAQATVTMAFHKLGTAGTPGFASCGEVEVAEIGIPEALAASHGVTTRMVERADVAAALPRSHVLDYKNRRGHLLVVAGSPGKRGAARLAAIAGLRIGAGLVTLASDSTEPGCDASIMTAATPDVASLLEQCEGKACVAIGPGMDRSERGRAMVDALIDSFHGPLVIDADGLGHLAGRPERVAAAAAAVLTPHPGEASRLLGIDRDEIEGDRVAAVRRLVEMTGATCVLKGARTLIGHGDEVFISPAGSPALATAGSGDVLTGVIAGLLAQGLTPKRAAVVGVYLHGYAGEIGGARHGTRGLIASDLPGLCGEAAAALGAPPR